MFFSFTDELLAKQVKPNLTNKTDH